MSSFVRTGELLAAHIFYIGTTKENRKCIGIIKRADWGQDKRQFIHSVLDYREITAL